ncbi:MAG: winged helix-turn-helix domain-containing protein [Candidatus Omnitrophota bacterium]
MITEIGITAGDIWHYLDTHGKSSLDQIVMGIATERDRVLMSIGWLSREGHIIVEGKSPNYQVYLRGR